MFHPVTSTDHFPSASYPNCDSLCPATTIYHTIPKVNISSANSDFNWPKRSAGVNQGVHADYVNLNIKSEKKNGRQDLSQTRRIPPFTFHSRPPPSYELAMMQKYGAGSALAIATARRRQRLFEECVSTELYLTPADTENDEEFGLSYDPVYVAALRHSNLTPFLTPFFSSDREDKFVKKASRQAYMRRRRSLVEALNNTIDFPQTCSIENLSTKVNDVSNVCIDDSESLDKWRSRPLSTDLSPSNRMLRRRAPAGKFPLSRLENELVAYRPSPSQRSAHQQPQKRSRSQPLCQHRLAATSAEAASYPNDLAINTKGIVPSQCQYIDDSIDEYGGGNFAVDYERLDYMGDASTSFGPNDSAATSTNPSSAVSSAYPRRRKQVHRGHLSRADRFSIDSEAGNSSQDSGIRSSMHSNSSTTTSTSSSSGIATNSSQKTSPSHSSSMLLVEAVWDHIAMLADELPFVSGDIITVLESTSNSGLWYGVCRDSSGWFPASYVRVKTSREIANRLSSNSFSSSTNSADLDVDVAALSESLIDQEDENFPPQMQYLRRKIVEELLDTERDYVFLLQNLVQGFLEQCRRRKELFGEERISRIFGNLEQILSIHDKLLRDLEVCFDQKRPEYSCLANCFIRNASF